MRRYVWLFLIDKENPQVKLKLAPIWIPRSDYIIALADSVSKFKDTDDWGLSEKSFKILQELSPTKFTVDTFANCTNKKCPKFYSKVQVTIFGPSHSEYLSEYL